MYIQGFLAGFLVFLSSLSNIHAIETVRCSAADEAHLSRCQDRCAVPAALRLLFKKGIHRDRPPCGTSCFDDFAAGRVNAAKYRDWARALLNESAVSFSEEPRELVMPPLPQEEGIEAYSHSLQRYYKALITQRLRPMAQTFMMVEAGAVSGAFRAASMVQATIGPDAPTASPGALERWIGEVFRHSGGRNRERGYQATLTVLEQDLEERLLDNELLLLGRLSERVRQEDVEREVRAALPGEH